MNKGKIKHILGGILQVFISLAILLIYFSFSSFFGSEDGLGTSAVGWMIIIGVPIYLIYMLVKNLIGRRKNKKQTASPYETEQSSPNQKTDIGDYIPEGADKNDPEVRAFWQSVKETHDRGHYSFVHSLLRDLALEHSDTFSKMIVQAHKVPKDNPFRDLWLENGGSEDDLEKETFKPRFRSLPGGDILIIMKMPKVVLPNEAEYIGINLKTKGNLNFYTFELTRDGKYVLCKWMKENGNNKPTHYLLSEAYENTSIETFYDGILKLTT